MAISVFLADDNLIVREGVRAILELEDDFEVVGQGADYDELVAGAEATEPQVIVTDIRMPPDFSREGIDAAKEVRQRNPGTGVVILSQFDDPDYAVSLLSEGAAGYAYLLKDRVGEGDQLARAVREVASGGSMLDPKIVQGLTNPVTVDSSLSTDEEDLLQSVAEGRSLKAIAVQRQTTAADVNSAVEALFAKLAEGMAAGRSDSLDRLKMLQRAIVDRKEQGEALSRLLPGGVATQILDEGRRPGETEELMVTVLMSDIRGYTTIAEHADPSLLAGQLHEHRAAMNRAIIDQGGTVMQFRGRRGDGRVRSSESERGSRRSLSVGGRGNARRTARAEWAMVHRRPCALRARNWSVDRAGRRRAPRVGGASRILARRRHRESHATPAAVGRSG